MSRYARYIGLYVQHFFARCRRPTGRNWAPVMILSSLLVALGSGIVPFLFADVVVTQRVAFLAPVMSPTCITQEEATGKDFYNHNLPGLEGPHAFGPPLKGKDAASKWQDFVNRLCGTDRHGPDRALWVAIRDALGQPRVQHLTDDRWRTEVQDFLDNVSGKSLRKRVGSFAEHTYMMTGHRHVGVVRVAPRTTAQRYLRIKFKDGGMLWLRTMCGGQPYVS